MYKVMKSNNSNLGKALGRAALDAAGAANGLPNRARTQKSERDKARCPRRQRKQKRWDTE
jgi:hypothetical protein